MNEKFKDGDLVISPTGKIFKVRYINGELTLNGRRINKRYLEFFKVIKVEDER